MYEAYLILLHVHMYNTCVISPWIELNKKFMQVEVDVQTNFSGIMSPVLEILLLFKFGQISLSEHGLLCITLYITFMQFPHLLFVIPHPHPFPLLSPYSPSI